MLKSAFLLVAFALIGIQQTSADVHVDGYTTKYGTYVPEHVRSDPDGNPNNNWSTRGNVNPYTGKPGYKNVIDYRR